MWTSVLTGELCLADPQQLEMKTNKPLFPSLCARYSSAFRRLHISQPFIMRSDDLGDITLRP
jgi:hypothetical protein